MTSASPSIDRSQILTAAITTSPVRTRCPSGENAANSPDWVCCADKEVHLAALDLDGPPGRVHLELPHARRAVAPAGDDASRIGRPIDGVHDAGVSDQPLLERAGRRVPDAHG